MSNSTFTLNRAQRTRFGAATGALLIAAICLALPAKAEDNYIHCNSVRYKIVDETGKQVVVSSLNNEVLANFTGDVVIPATVQDNSTGTPIGDFYTVTGIESNAFAATPITSVTIEAPITSLPFSTFAGCKNLTSVTLPESLTQIGQYCFASVGVTDGAPNSTPVQINLPAGLNAISDHAFQNANLSAVTIPPGCFIYQSAFQGAYIRELTFPSSPTSHFYIYDGNFDSYEKYDVLDADNSGVNPERTITIGTREPKYLLEDYGVFSDVKLLKTVTIPQALGRIPANAFNRSSLESVTFTGMDAGTFIIGNKAFWGCNNLSSVTFESGVAGQRASIKSIGKKAFGWTAITSISLPETESLGYKAFAGCPITEMPADAWPENPITEIGIGIFKQCDKLTSVTLPSHITEIPAETFYRCSSLTNVDNFQGITSIGNSAFEQAGDATGATPLTISPSISVSNIGKWAFANTKGLQTTLTLNNGMEEIPSHAFYNSPVTGVAVPSTVTSIGDYAFGGCATLTSLTLSEGVKEISTHAFYNSGVTAVAVPSTVTSIGDYAFGECAALTSLTMPEPAKGPDEFSMTIGGYAFYKTSVEEFTTPLWMTEFPAHFLDEATTKRLTLHEGVTKIGDCAFLNTYYLQIVGGSFPSGINNYGAAAFQSSGSKLADGVSLGSLTLGEGTTLGYEAFKNARLSGLVYTGCNITIGDAAISGATEFVTSMVFPDCMTEIPANICNGMTNLTEVTLPANCTKIGNAAFKNTKITSVTFPSTLTEIGDEAYNGCKQLTSIEFPDMNDADREPITIGKNVFADATSLTDFTFPAWMTTVPKGFFTSCGSLRNVVFAPGTTEIGSGAFNGCGSLRFPDGLPETITIFREFCFYSCSNSSFLETMVLRHGSVYERDCISFANIKRIVIAGDGIVMGYYNTYYQPVEEVEFYPEVTEIPSNFACFINKSTKIIWPDHIKKIGAGAFYNSASRDLIDVSFLTDKNGNKNVLDMTRAPFDQVEYIGNGAFRHTSLKEVKWGETPISSGNLGTFIFQDCYNLKSTNIPVWMAEVPAGLFYDCEYLENVTWDPGVRESVGIGARAFMSTGIKKIEFGEAVALSHIGYKAYCCCYQVKEIVWPPAACADNPDDILGESAFENAAGFDTLTIPDYITYIPESCFASVGWVWYEDEPTIIPNPLIIPASVKRIGPRAFTYAAITEVVIMGDTKLAGTQIFEYCEYLKKATFKSPALKGMNDTFGYCGALEEVVFAEGTHVHDIQEAFYECKSLKSFPDQIPGDWFCKDAFTNCASLLHLTLPSHEVDIPGCSSLQSIDFYNGCDSITPNNTTFPRNRFGINSKGIDGAPLLGVSEIHDVRYNDKWRTAYINTYSGSSRTDKGLLVAPHGLSWLFKTKGYQKPFNVIERKAPEMKVYGDLKSNYTLGDDHNEYTAYLRWQLEESDFNPNGNTVYHLWRDGEKVTDIIIKPQGRFQGSVADGALSGTVDANRYQVWFQKPGGEEERNTLLSTSLTFNKGESETEFTRLSLNQPVDLYFDYSTGERLGQVHNEDTQYYSWFVYKDVFNSPLLAEGNVPAQYEYKLTMDSYDYEEPYNNTDYEVAKTAETTTDADGRTIRTVAGRAYHYESHNLSELDLDKDGTPTYATMAVPAMAHPGTYSISECAADKRHALDPAQITDASGQGLLLYSFADGGTMLTHHIDDSHVVEGIDVYNVTDVNNPVLLQHFSSVYNSKDTGDIYVPNAKPGMKIQTVTTTNANLTTAEHKSARGSFGSPIITVPGAPKLELEVSDFKGIWDSGVNGHYHGFGMEANLHLSPLEIDGMGYGDESGQIAFSKDRYRIGIWRIMSYDTSNTANTVYTAPRRTDSGSSSADDDDSDLYDPYGTTETLIYFMDADGNACDNTFDLPWTGNCANCDAARTFTTSEPFTYHDVIPVSDEHEYDSAMNVSYTARLYVQDTVDTTKWKVAEATTASTAAMSVNNSPYTGVEAPDWDDDEARHFTLQGIEIRRPQKGDIVIRVDHNGAHRVRFTK